MASENISQSRPIVTWAQAKAAGLNRFLTGKPCKRNHISERYFPHRECVECSKVRAQQDRKSKNEKRKVWRRRDPERERRAQKRANDKYYLLNRDKAISRAKEYYKANKKRTKQRILKWRRENREKVLGYAKTWRDNNHDKRQVYWKNQD